MEKITIPSRENKKIAIIIENVKNPKGLAFVAHGLGGYKEQDHIKTFAEAFLENNFVVVRFDARNTLGESEGNYEDANTTNYYEDLEDVITWAKTQDWYKEPFYLAGHSLAGPTIIKYSENHPSEVKALAPVSSVVSATHHKKRTPPGRLEEQNKTGWRKSPSASKPGVIKKLKWHQFIKDLETFDIITDINKLTMPVLLITGELDNGCPEEDQRVIYDRLPGDKELHIIREAPHTFREKNHLAEIKEIFKKWISKVENIKQ